MGSLIANVIKATRSVLLGVAFVCWAANAPQIALAQKAPEPASVPAFAAGMIDHMQKMRRYRDPDQGAQHTPPVIRRFSADRDPSGAIATFQPNGATVTSNNAFFQNLGTNGRTCFTCHQPQSGWSVVPGDIAERFEKSRGADPIFRLVDGATCPNADVSTIRAKRNAYKLLIDKGLIRIGLSIPATAEFRVEIAAGDDLYGCNTDPATGIAVGIVSSYRRPLPSTNLGFLSAVMWDGREFTGNGLDSDLKSQARDATFGHAQAAVPPTDAQLAEIVAFEKGIFTAQIFDKKAKFLTGDNAKGGPVALSLQPFFIGINDPLGNNPTGAPFTSQIFDLFRPWLSSGERYDHGDPMAAGDELLKSISATDNWRFNDHELGMVSEHRRSVARGEEVFNTKPINIVGVSGLNDDLNMPSIPGFCGTCHDSPNVGNHSVKAPLDIGIADAGDKKPPVLDISGLPVFTVTCTQGALAGQVYKVTDLGRAMISGKCKDIGRFKGPILRGLASRAPFFHNGSATTLQDVVNFYDQRFSIGLTHREKADLVNFLDTL
jgi:hypothetical protein